jgi:hypothetical protein
MVGIKLIGQEIKNRHNAEKPVSIRLTFLNFLSTHRNGATTPYHRSMNFRCKNHGLTSETLESRSFRERPRELLDCPFREHV